MDYVIYGAGGIGGGIGAQLAGAGHEVTLIARGEHLVRIQEAGLRVRTPEGDSIVEVPAVGHPSEVSWNGGEVVLFTMKSQDSRAALEDLRASVGDGVAVVMAQNGVANERMAARLFTDVYGMLIYMPATFLEPGVVLLHATPLRGTLHAGLYPRGVDSTVEEICADLAAAGFESEPDPGIMRIKYGKLMMNLGNAVQALCGLEVDLKELFKALRIEGMQCLDAAGIEFVSARELVERNRNNYDFGEIEGCPRQGGSSWQGLMRGTDSIEVDYLNGEIVLLGALHGVPTPLNRTVQRLASTAVRRGLMPGDTTPEEIWTLAAQEGKRAGTMLPGIPSAS